MGNVASPLLAGFSLAAIVGLLGKRDELRFPDETMIFLALAACSLIGSLQFSFNARMNLWSAADATNWSPELDTDNSLKEDLIEAQNDGYRNWWWWKKFVQSSYNIGIVSIFVSLGLILVPAEDKEDQCELWIAPSIAGLAILMQLIWMALAWKMRHRDQTESVKPMKFWDWIKVCKDMRQSDSTRNPTNPTTGRQ
ncbi:MULTISPECIES: hypothetical protein [Pseudofrankia]|uniref:hypothetical protein n=1 Tax=Pseudofrankia TaxID=2994363 RepID=UPI0008DA6D5C|nr:MULTISPECIES: hypothetical protein [Pseudofrankia]